MVSLNLNALFLFVLNQSMVASFVIVGVLLLRLCLKPAPKKFSYALWAVVLFRLVCPLSFESVWSVIPISAQPISQSSLVITAAQTKTVLVEPQDATQGVPGDDATSDALTVFAPDSALQSAVDAATGTGVTQAVDVAASAEATVSASTANNTGTGANLLQTWLFAARWVWLLGMAGLLIYSLSSMVRLLRLLSHATHLAPEALPDGMVRQCPCEVYASSKIETAFVLGLVHPNIYLPTHLSQREMRYILQHEQTHIRRGDHIVKFVAFFVLCIHWFNPLVWVAFFLAGQDMELSCDESVIKALGAGIKKEYSASLLSLATGKLILGGTPLAFGEGDTKSRIQNVLRYRKPTRWVSALAACLLLCAAVALLSTRQSEEGLAPSDSAQASTAQTQASLQAITLALQQDTLPDETAQLLQNFAQVVVQDAVDTLNDAGRAPADGSNSYYVTDAVITGIVSQNTGAATECFAVGTYLVEYQIVLSNTEGIALPEGYQLSSADATTAQGEGSATNLCTPTQGTQPYLYTFGGAYGGTPEWQVLGMLTYDEIDHWYGGPSMVAIYGDCITASGIKLLNSCLADEVDFEMFAFAAPDGLLVDITTPASTSLVWYADINHAYRDEAIWVDYAAFTARAYTGVVVFWQRSYEDYAHTGLDVTLGAGDNTQKPTLYGIYTDPQGDEYLFAYASSTGDAASLGGTDYAYALYALFDQGEDGEICAVEEGSYCFAPGQTVSAEGVSLQAAVDTINGYAKNSTILISTEQTVQYYTVDGRKASLDFTQECPTYFYSIGATDSTLLASAPDMHYYLLTDPLESASGQLTALDQPLYMQVVV